MAKKIEFKINQIEIHKFKSKVFHLLITDIQPWNAVSVVTGKQIAEASARLLTVRRLVLCSEMV